jgi:hypothetical protein
VDAIRRAVIEALPVETSLFGNAPEIGQLYIPPGHAKALRPECNLVIGTRGVGKSMWTASLGDAALRKSIGGAVPELDSTDVFIAYSESPKNDDYPEPDTFDKLRRDGIPPSSIWKAIIARKLDDGGDIPKTDWGATAAWIRGNPEPLAKILSSTAARLKGQKKRALFVFDAIDRLGDDWSVLDANALAILQTALWLKPHQVISAKIFLREDQFKRNVGAFPDASKILATRADLNWALNDLHGLLWQRLLNAPGEHGKLLRALCGEKNGGLVKRIDNYWELSDAGKKDTAIQRELFGALAGPWMGRDRRRGVPYLWSVGHIADGEGRTSPRSFLAAIGQAASDSEFLYPSHEYAIHYESIKRGVQKASEIRVAEIREDYPWIPSIMNTLSGLTVPCDFERIELLWRRTYPNGPSSIDSGRLPPEHLDKGWNGIREDLVKIGIFQEKSDGRIDMPDLYRVGFSLGRKGGVRPRTPSG